MHEASLAGGLLKLALDSREAHNSAMQGARAGRITEIRCAHGLLACFEAETLKACFELLAEGGPAEGAALVLELEPLPCECGACGHKFTLWKRSFSCPKCGGGQISFQGGHGLELKSIQVESEEDAND